MMGKNWINMINCNSTTTNNNKNYGIDKQRQ